MKFRAGTRIGCYEIIDLIGKGGMGEVYCARDTNLKREVAIKVLPENFSQDRERLLRFQREAELLASLNHPHIAAIYHLERAEVPFLVLELVAGETLEQRIRRGIVPLPETLRIAQEIAAAVEAAHHKGIIHRDLKPANIKLTPDGSVKVLDFGLAKAADLYGPATDLSQQATGNISGTHDGAIVGTPAYMSPEQVRAKPLDTRTDVWSFGCVLFELITGCPAFAGETMSDTIASVLHHDPPWKNMPGKTPAGIRRVLERCLEKDAAKRPRDIGDIRLEIEHTETELQAKPGAPAKAPSRWVPITAIAAVLLLIAATSAVVFRRGSPPPPTLEPPLQLTDFTDSALQPSLSSDGHMLTFIRGGGFGNSSARGQIYVKILPKGDAVELTHDELPKEQPTFSPDGSRIIYTVLTGGFRWDAWQVPVLGGFPQPFMTNASGLVWLDDQHMLYSIVHAGFHMGIVSSGPNGVDRKSIYTPPGENSMAHRAYRSPDRNSLLVAEMDGRNWLPCRLMPSDGSSVGKPVGPQEAQCTTAAWSPDGHWMYFSSNAGGYFHVWRQRYPDGKPEQFTSGPTEQEGTALTPDGKYLITSMGLQQAAVWIHDSKGERPLTTEGFTMLPTMTAAGDRVFYLVRTGAQAYVSGELWSVNLVTGERKRAVPGRIMSSYSLSADAKKVVFTTAENPLSDGIWVADLEGREPPRQLTHSQEFRALWGAPGEIIYMSQGDVRHIYRMNEDGTGNAMIVPDVVNHLITVSPDGRWVVAIMPQAPNTDGSQLVLFSTRGEKNFPMCQDGCTVGFGPARIQAPLINWSADGKFVFVSLQYFGKRTQLTVALPYRATVPLDQLWPRGMKSEQDVPLNPGAKVINEPDAFPAINGAYLYWKRSTQSNLYRIPIAN